MPKIKGWKKNSDKPKYQVWESRYSRVAGEKFQKPTHIIVGFDEKARAEDWTVQIIRPNKNPKAPGFQRTKKEFRTKCKAETFAIQWMRNHPKG